MFELKPGEEILRVVEKRVGPRQWRVCVVVQTSPIEVCLRQLLDDVFEDREDARVHRINYARFFARVKRESRGK